MRRLLIFCNYNIVSQIASLIRFNRLADALFISGFEYLVLDGMQINIFHTTL